MAPKKNNSSQSPTGNSFFSSYHGDHFASSQQQKIADNLFTNTDKPVFIAKNLPPVIAGALIGRHSHSPYSMRRTLLENYIPDLKVSQKYGAEMKKWNKAFDIEAANGLFERIFVGWGHDSLAATVGLVVGFDGVSQLAAKAIEDNRLGVAPIERSTRYGFFGQKKNGHYDYARPPRILNSRFADLYQKAIDEALDLYVSLQKPVAEKYQEKFPKADKRQTKQMAFDAVRVLLTAAAKTNLGINVNVQAAENMIIKLRASHFQEMKELGLIFQKEMAKISPSFTQRLEGEFGKNAINYRKQTGTEANSLKEEILGRNTKENDKDVSLVDYDRQAEEKVIARILSSTGEISYQKSLKRVAALTKKEKQTIINRYIGKRPNRKSHIGRPFEEANFSFRLVCRFAEWRDLQRNRILTPFWGNFNYHLGIDIGEDLKEFGFEKVVSEKLNFLKQAYEKISQEFPSEAQYLIAFGTKVPYEIKINFRELAVMTELRTGPGTHKDYAIIASKMAKEAIRVCPLFKSALQFVNYC